MAGTKTIAFLLFASFIAIASAGNFYKDFDITWGDGRGKIINNGQLLTLSLDKTSGSGFQSKNEYLFGKIDMQLKLVRGNSAGTVTAYYVSLHFIYIFYLHYGLTKPYDSWISFKLLRDKSDKHYNLIQKKKSYVVKSVKIYMSMISITITFKALNQKQLLTHKQRRYCFK